MNPGQIRVEESLDRHSAGQLPKQTGTIPLEKFLQRAVKVETLHRLELSAGQGSNVSRLSRICRREPVKTEFGTTTESGAPSHSGATMQGTRWRFPDARRWL